jgi:hypothetical protein
MRGGGDRRDTSSCCCQMFVSGSSSRDQRREPWDRATKKMVLSVRHRVLEESDIKCVRRTSHEAPCTG